MKKRNLNILMAAKREISLSTKTKKPKKGKGARYARAKEKNSWRKEF